MKTVVSHNSFPSSGLDILIKSLVGEGSDKGPIQLLEGWNSTNVTPSLSLAVDSPTFNTNEPTVRLPPSVFSTHPLVSAGGEGRDV